MIREAPGSRTPRPATVAQSVRHRSSARAARGRPNRPSRDGQKVFATAPADPTGGGQRGRDPARLDEIQRVPDPMRIKGVEEDDGPEAILAERIGERSELASTRRPLAGPRGDPPEATAGAGPDQRPDAGHSGTPRRSKGPPPSGTLLPMMICFLVLLGGFSQTFRRAPER